jgi:hypothetical protein
MADVVGPGNLAYRLALFSPCDLLQYKQTVRKGDHHLFFPPLWDTARKTKMGGGAKDMDDDIPF